MALALLTLPRVKEYQSIWHLAWPLIISNLSIPLLGLVDTAVMGHLDHAKYLGAVAVGATVLSFIYWAFGFLRMGTVGLTAQAYGADSLQQQWQMLYLPGIVAGSVGLLITLLSPLYIQYAVSFMQSAPEVQKLALSYLQIRLFSAPAVLMTYVAIGWLLGRQNSKGPLLILLITNISNIIFNLILVLGFDMASDGVAWGSLLADYLGFAMATWLVIGQLRHFPKLTFSWKQSQAIIHKLLALNGFLFIRTLILLFAHAFITAKSGQLGTDVLAANTLLLGYVALLAYFLDGFAHAAEAICGRIIGKKDQLGFYRAVNAAGLFSLLLALIASVSFYALHPLYIQLMTSLPSVQAAAIGYASWVVWVPVISVWSYLFDGIYVGSAQSKAMFHTVWIALLAMMLAWFSADPNNHHLWFSYLTFCLLRSLVATALYLRLSYRQAWW